MISTGIAVEQLVMMYKFIRPATLVEGQFYMLSARNGSQTHLSPVTFLAYTSCPAVVIYSNGAGQKLRGPRAHLFLCADGNQS